MATRISELNINAIENVLRRSIQPMEKSEMIIADKVIKKLCPVVRDMISRSNGEGLQDGQQDKEYYRSN